MSAAHAAHQFELLLPWQLRALIAKRPVAYIPLGTYEWHGEHLPIGLDSLTSHGICLRAAALDGGVVLPPNYYSVGGGHGHYPWTIIKSEPDEIEAQLNFTLQRMETFGIKLLVIFSGHFPDTQLDMIDRVASQWNERGTSLEVFSTAVNRIEGLQFAPDHAGIFETTLLFALRPDLVQLDRLKSLVEAPLTQDDEIVGEVRHDPVHPIYGVFGPDPRHLRPEEAKPLLDACVNWLVTRVRARL
jgi:creatinine amidohydrolase